MVEDSDIQWRTVQHLARDLMLAKGDDNGPSRGRAVFLVGAGCSVSAGIPAARGVSRLVALHLAQAYLGEVPDGAEDEERSDEALRRLVTAGHVERNRAFAEDGKPQWGELYQYFFAEHLKSPNQQRELIYGLIEKSKGKLNWAHACLGELVAQRYVNTVLTTNFDQLVLTGIFRTGIIPVVADGFSALNRIVAEPLVPQLIHLHGSMNTYAMRNDPRTLAEPMHDHRPVTMLNGVLQRANLLVVVGYAGGEEGLMKLLLQASSSLEQLVIYWISYEDDAARLTDDCRKLLAGENKFAIPGGEADRFFGDLMQELGIGQPSWVADPIGELFNHRVELVAPESVSEAAILIESYREKIEAAKAGAPPPEEPRQKAARLRAAGEYRQARDALGAVDPAADPGAARIHALNALSLFEDDATANRAMLDTAITEFEALIAATSGREQTENVLSLLDALFDLSEAGGDNDDVQALERIVATASEWLGKLGPNDAAGRGRLLFYRAQAYHRRAESNSDDVEDMRRAAEDYRAALDALGQAPDRTVSTIEVREGLAAALQVLGASDEEDDQAAREAVQLFREVAEHPRRDATQPEDEAGLHFNLAGALIALMQRVDAEEAQRLGNDARSALLRAERAYIRAGDGDKVAEVRQRLESLPPQG